MDVHLLSFRKSSLPEQMDYKAENIIIRIFRTVLFLDVFEIFTGQCFHRFGEC